MAEYGDDVIGTLLQIEGMDDILRSCPNQPFEEERIKMIEKQQEIITEVLRKLSSNKNEFEETLEQILFLADDSEISLQKHFFILLKQRRYLKYVCEGLKSISFRTLQLVFCVLTKILENCTEDDLVLFTNTLFLELNFIGQTKLKFSKLLDECSEGDQDHFNSDLFEEHFSTLAVSLNFLVSLLKRLEKVEDKWNGSTIDFLEVGMDCLKSCLHEEEIVLYAVELVRSLLRQHEQLWLILIKSSYRIFFSVLSLHPYEGKKKKYFYKICKHCSMI